MTTVTFLWLASNIVLFLLPAVMIGVGGSPERIAGGAFVAAGALSWLSYRHDGSAFASFEPALAATDVAVSAIILFLALFALRWWTSCALWFQAVV